MVPLKGASAQCEGKLYSSPRPERAPCLQYEVVSSPWILWPPIQPAKCENIENIRTVSLTAGPKFEGTVVPLLVATLNRGHPL